MAKKYSRLMNLQKDYENVGILKDKILEKEDGMRTSGKKGEYEWWYFDNKFPDGSSLVVIFFVNKITTIGNGFDPYVSFDFVSNTNEQIHTEYHPKEGTWNFSKDGCDIKMGNCYCKGNLNEYEIYFENEVVKSKISLKGNVPSWRPHTGRISFNEKKYFAWLPSVPEGNSNVEIQYSNGKTINLQGTGYHDHNWGDTPMFFLMHHWYWGRAKIGNYTVISSYITSNRKHSLCETPVFMIAKDGKIIAEDGLNCLTYNEYDYEFVKETNKHFARTLEYDYNDGVNRYVIKYHKKEDVEVHGMDSLATKFQRFLLKLLKIEGSYHRVAGIATLDRYENGVLIEHVEANAMWEQMYFEKDRLREIK